MGKSKVGVMGMPERDIESPGVMGWGWTQPVDFSAAAVAAVVGALPILCVYTTKAVIMFYHQMRTSNFGGKRALWALTHLSQYF